MAQNERETTRKRQAEVIAAAQKRGVRFGRTIKKSPENFSSLIKLWERGKFPIQEFSTQIGSKETTFYRRLGAWRLMKGKLETIKK
ncbi:MAG: hypothetical protein FWG71_07550 [Synergistaceae bacterium]|nr:hypothetical protein [Synergistaceae bacterium]